VKVTNSLGMPDHAFKAISRLKGRTTAPELDYIGATTLMGAPLSRFLRARYWDQLEFDVADTMNAIQGQMGHLLFDKVESKTVTEIRLEVEFEGMKIKGIMDYYDPETFTVGDSKFKQVKKAQADIISEHKDLRTQLNIYCWMARLSGLRVEHLQGDIYINGWNRMMAYGNTSYPKASYIKVEVPIWKDNFTEQYIRERLKAHDTPAIRLLKILGPANMLAISEVERLELDKLMNQIPICTDEERWASKPKFAVMKEGQKKAVRVFEDAMDACMLSTTLPKSRVEERKGGDIRCLFYCDVKQFCPYKKDEMPSD
jgi:hypothetical protein